MVALGTEFAFSTFTTCPPSVPKYNVDEGPPKGATVKAETLDDKKVEFSRIKLGALLFLSSSLKSSQS